MIYQDWFWSFVAAHVGRCAGLVWPVVDSSDAESLAFFDEWSEEFHRHGVKQRVAYAASALMIDSGDIPPAGIRHRKQLMRYVARVWADDRTPREGLTEWERMQRQCRSCPECAGCGMTARPMYRDNRTYRAAFYCLCPAGDFLAGMHGQGKDSVSNRIRHLVQYPELWDAALDHPLWPLAPKARDWPLEPCWGRTHAESSESPF